MAELRSSGGSGRGSGGGGGGVSRKIPNVAAAGRSAYDDVYGGPPRYSGPFAARLGDYSEIFGGLASSCSIPVLDLPPALDGYDAPRSSGLDYSEIFGGCDLGDFAVSYEELVAGRERVEAEPEGPEIPSSNRRAPKETEFGHQVTEVSEFSPYGANRDHKSCLEKDQISSNANHLNDLSTKLNMSYHKASRGNIEDAISEAAHITQLHAVSGFTSDVDANPPLDNIRSDNPPNMVTGDLSLNADLDGRLSDQKQGQTFSPSSSAASPKNSGNDLNTDQKQFATKCPTSEDGPANFKHHSRSSSNHSSSSGDMYYPDFTYLTVSDISLRTQPLRLLPPSRPPPKLVNNQEISKMKIYENSKSDLDEVSLSKPIVSHLKHSNWDAPKRHAPQVPVRDSSSFFDVEVDASSAAAASAAAMKEAMEQAQARLKSAKESMERRRENFQNRKKLGQHEGTKCEEGKEDKAAQEVKIFSEAGTQKTFIKEKKKKNEFALAERQKARGAANVASDHKDKERHVVSDQQVQQTVKANGFKSCQTAYRLNERTGEWKTDKQFYELVNNEQKFKVIKEFSNQEFDEKIPKATTTVNKEKENETKEAGLPYEFERKGNLWEVNETHEREENAKKSKAGNTACREEKKELPNTIPEIFVQEENVNKLEEVYESHQQVKDESKLGEAQEAHVSQKEVKKPNIGEDAPSCGETEMKLKPSVDACKFEGVHESEEKESKLEAAKEVCEREDSELKTYASCQPHGSEKKLKAANKTGMRDENEKEIKFPYASCLWEAGEKVEAAPELDQCENSEKTREKITLECYQKENKNKLKGTSLTSEQEESRKLNRNEEASMLVENELRLKIAQEASEMEDNLEELKAARGPIRSRENEKIEAIKEARFHDYDEKKTREDQPEFQQDENELKAAKVPCELENSEVLTVAVLVHGKKENENIKEVHVAVDMKEKHNIFNAARELFRLNKDLEDVREAKMLERKGNMLSSDQNTTKSCPSVATGNTPDMQKIEERENERRMEREREREQEKERTLEEEKEREREREKDRIAVERATREAHERAFTEARERAERVAVERVTAEARQRALAEAREKAEKTSAEALEKSLAEKSSREARLRAERAAVERATTEARERAVERALAEKAAADARERAEKLNAASSRDRMRRDNERDNETEEHFRASDKGDSGTRVKPSSFDMQDFTHDSQFQNAGSSSSGQKHSDSFNHGEGESALRCKARLERHQRTVERGAKALAEKNMRDILAQREQAERNRLAETLDADVRRWSSGKEGNLRALLSTLQYILGPESGWQPIPLTDVITAAAVKKAYRKATLCVHPDKLQQRGASIQQKYICEKVFDLLKDAWNRFNSEER